MCSIILNISEINFKISEFLTNFYIFKLRNVLVLSKNIVQILSYLTFTELNVKQYVFIATLATCSEAQSYCRTHHTDLAMIENEAENSAVKQLIPVGVNVWIGLYRVPWSWSDKSPSLFRRWVSSEPNNNGGIQNCVCENTAHMWGDETCSGTKVFICERGDY
uniref:C-type lectin domain-containing protein n=1 Tax=Xiphophorus maculatus TaxID=8083 RepID=A0A3B5RF82_XIPMA